MVTMRSATQRDTAALLALAQDAGMFGVDDIGFLAGMLDEAFADNAQGHDWQVVTDNDRVIGAVMVAPELGPGVWNALFLGVDPSRLRRGIARRLMTAIETRLRAENARMLMVETSSMPHFGPARALYTALGYIEAGRIPGYFGVDDDKVIFVKSL